MKLIEQTLRDYPTVFGNNEFARMRVLIHMLTVCGSGYEWQKGKIVVSFFQREKTKKELDGMDKSMIRDANMTPPCINVDDLIDSKYGGRLIDYVPKDITPGWRKELKNFFIFFDDASIYGFKKYVKNQTIFSYMIEDEGKSLLQEKHDKIMKTVPNWENLYSNEKLLKKLKSLFPKVSKK